MNEDAFDHKTVREWMAVDGIEEMDLMTGSGYIHLKRSEFPGILAGSSVMGHLGWKGSEHEIRPDDFLDETVTSCRIRNGRLSGIS